MNYGELKDHILSLGFETSDVLTDTTYQKVFRDGINRALAYISVDFPIIGRYDLSLSNSGEYIDIDLAEETDFDVFLNATIEKTVDGRKQILPFSDLVVEQDTVIRIYDGVDGDLTLFYRTRPTFVTTSTADNVDITVHFKAEQLLPLLATYYIWNDDDPEKAAKWRNEYEDMKSLVLAVPTAKPYRFVGGM